MKRFARLFRWGWNNKKHLATYGFVGGSSVVLDFGLLKIFNTWLFPWSAALSVALAQLIVLGWNYTLHRVYTFQSKGMVKKQLMRYAVLTIWNYVIGVFVMYVFADMLGFEPLHVRIATVGLVVMWNYLLFRFWIYT